MYPLSCNKHVLIVLTFLRILKTSQKVLCVSKKCIMKKKKKTWSYSHLGDTTLHISVVIQIQLLL